VLLCVYKYVTFLGSSLLGAYYKGKHCVQQNKQQELMLLIDYGTQLIHVNTGVLLLYFRLFSKE
jgi:hypothetical protein